MTAKRNVYVWVVRLLMWLAVGLTSALALFVVGYVLVQGIPHLSWQFLSTKPSYLSGNIGILPDILNTLYIVIATLLSGLPLGVGRAIGEAMAVMMVAGNAANMPDSLFQSVRFLTTAVASEMSYSSGLQRQALFSIALVLFLFIMMINAVLNHFLKGEKI